MRKQRQKRERRGNQTQENFSSTGPPPTCPQFSKKPFHPFKKTQNKKNKNPGFVCIECLEPPLFCLCFLKPFDMS